MFTFEVRYASKLIIACDDATVNDGLLHSLVVSFPP